MNDQTSSTDPPESPNESTRSPISVSDEIINAANDETDMAMLVRDGNILVQTSSIHDDGIHVQMGVCEPSEVVFSRALIDNPVYDDQAEEVDVHQAEPTVEVPYALSPTTWDIVEILEPLSPVIQNATIYPNSPDDPTLLYERETMAEPVENEDDEIEVLFTERVSTQTVDSPGAHPHPPLDHDIYITVPIIVIDLTQDDDGENTATLPIQPDAVVSPVVIDLTEDDDVNEDIVLPQAPVIQSIDHINNNEQVNQPVNDPYVTERLLPTATSSSEATDQNSVFAAVIDNSSLTMETSAHLQVPILSLRTSKRSSSSDEIHGAKKKHIAGRVKPGRYSVV